MKTMLQQVFSRRPVLKIGIKGEALEHLDRLSARLGREDAHTIRCALSLLDALLTVQESGGQVLIIEGEKTRELSDIREMGKRL